MRPARRQKIEWYELVGWYGLFGFVDGIVKSDHELMLIDPRWIAAAGTMVYLRYAMGCCSADGGTTCICQCIPSRGVGAALGGCELYCGGGGCA